jgi:hypothetical protein
LGVGVNELCLVINWYRRWTVLDDAYDGDEVTVWWCT